MNYLCVEYVFEFLFEYDLIRIAPHFVLSQSYPHSHIAGPLPRFYSHVGARIKVSPPHPCKHDVASDFLRLNHTTFSGAHNSISNILCTVNDIRL